MATTPPLVSIVAIAFNNAELIEATLNSIVAQNFADLELIVCDDASTDGTPRVIERWVAAHGSRFHKLKVILNPANVGICQNLAGGIAQATGAWIKPIACDDILCVDAISKFVAQTVTEQTELAFSQITIFRERDGHFLAEKNLVSDAHAGLIAGDPRRLLNAISNENFLPAPGAFYSRALLERAGGIDTGYRHLDDWPLWVRMLELVTRVSWIDKPLVLYRASEHSSSQRQLARPINKILHEDRQLFFVSYQANKLGGVAKWHQTLQHFRNKLTIGVFANSWTAHRCLMPLQLLSPLSLYQLVLVPRRLMSVFTRNAGPLLRGMYYFGLRGLRQRVRVHGAIQLRIPPDRVSLGYGVNIHANVSLVGKTSTTDSICLGAFSTLEHNVYLNAHGGRIAIGDHVHIGVGCVLQGMGVLTIASSTMLGPYVQIYTSNHRTSVPALPRRLLGERSRPVVVGSNCWIGASSVLLSGSRIENDAVLPAGTIVRRQDKRTP